MHEVNLNFLFIWGLFAHAVSTLIFQHGFYVFLLKYTFLLTFLKSLLVLQNPTHAFIGLINACFLLTVHVCLQGEQSRKSC